MLQGGFFAKELGSGIRQWMFNAVHKMDPETILFVNELDVFAAPYFTQVNILFLQLQYRLVTMTTIIRINNAVHCVTFRVIWK